MIEIPFVVFLLIIVAFLWLFAAALANRLNRLHIRTDNARISLEGALAARASVIAALQPDLVKEARETTAVPLKATDMGARSDAENTLLNHLADSTAQTVAFVEAATRVDVAARFYNDAVGDTLAIRKRPVVRICRLAGRAPLPEYYEARAVMEIRKG